jgi:hypothetical protein
MQLRLAHFCQFLLHSYLRIKEEYWIEGQGLGKEIGRLKKKRCQGFAMLIAILKRREVEKGRLTMEEHWVGMSQLKAQIESLEKIRGRQEDERLSGEVEEEELDQEIEQEGMDQLQVQFESLEMQTSDESSWLYAVD